MKSKLFFLVTILTALCYLGIAYAGEEITLTTYYPAPYGEYGGLAVGDPINGYTAPADPIDLIVEGNVGIGTTVVPSYDKLLVNGGWLLVNFSGATSWGDTSARIGVCKTDNTAGLGPWHMSQNNDGKFAIHQNGVGDRLIIDGNGNVGIGTMSPGEKLVIADDTDADLDITTYGDNNDQSSIHLHKARGTAGAPSAVISTSDLGTWSSKGWDGSAWRTGAQIMMEVDGTPGSGDMPGRIMFLTTQDGGTTEYERMRITNTGNVGIGTTNPQAQLDVSSTTGGLLAPRFADHAAIVAAMPSPVEGMMAYNLADHVMEYHNGTTWVPMGDGGGFGDWVDKTSVASSPQGPVATDGFVVAYGSYITLYGYMDGTSNPSTLRAKDNGVDSASITMPVKKGHYWKVTHESSENYKVYWIPFGT